MLIIFNDKPCTISYAGNFDRTPKEYTYESVSIQEMPKGEWPEAILVAWDWKGKRDVLWGGTKDEIQSKVLGIIEASFSNKGFVLDAE